LGGCCVFTFILATDHDHDDEMSCSVDHGDHVIWLSGHSAQLAAASRQGPGGEIRAKVRRGH
jgi:hypothetical protein